RRGTLRCGGRGARYDQDGQDHECRAGHPATGQMNTADDGPHWLTRGIMLTVVAALAWSAHVLLSSRTLRTMEAPQHVALVDSAPPAPPRSEPDLKPLPEEQEAAQDAPTQGLEDNMGIEE